MKAPSIRAGADEWIIIITTTSSSTNDLMIVIPLAFIIIISTTQTNETLTYYSLAAPLPAHSLFIQRFHTRQRCERGRGGRARREREISGARNDLDREGGTIKKNNKRDGGKAKETSWEKKRLTKAASRQNAPLPSLSRRHRFVFFLFLSVVAIHPRRRSTTLPPVYCTSFDRQRKKTHN